MRLRGILNCDLLMWFGLTGLSQVCARSLLLSLLLIRKAQFSLLS